MGVLLALLVPAAPGAASELPASKAVRPVQGPPPAPAVQAAAAIVIDMADGAVLFEKNSAARRAVASTTKILTALVVLESATPSEVVTASGLAEDVGNTDPLVSQLHLVRGEQVTVMDLLHALMLSSANDAAVALAEHAGRSVGGFVETMNEKARALGAVDTHFINPHGLDHPDHYSSARDLALIARAAMANPAFRQIAATQRHAVRRRNGATVVANRNTLLGAYPEATGIKTGQTAAAGRALVASARRGDEERIAVVLASPDPAAEAGRLLDYAFDAFTRAFVARTDKPWGYATHGDGVTWRLVPRAGLSLLIPRNGDGPAVALNTASLRLHVAGWNGERTVQLEYRCGDGPCAPRRAPRRGALEWLWDLLGPLARIAAAARA